MAATATVGTAIFKIDGTQYQLRGNFKISNVTGLVNTGFANADGTGGFTAKHVNPMIEGDLSDGGSVSLAVVTGLSGNTVTLELVNGKTYVLADGWYEGEAALNAVEGTFPFKFACAPGGCTELLAQ